MRIQTVKTVDIEAILFKKSTNIPVSVDKIKIMFGGELERKKISYREVSSNYLKSL